MEQMGTKIQEIRDQVKPGAAMPENVVPFSVMKNSVLSPRLLDHLRR